MAAPYRDAPPRPATPPLRRAWWETFMRLLSGVVLLAGSYLLIRHVASGWIGQAVAALVAVAGVVALLTAFSARRGACPRCDEPLEIGGDDGHLCPDCDHFLRIERGQLVPTPDGHVAKGQVYGVKVPAGAHVWPPFCAVCDAPATRDGPLTIDKTTHRVPYCATHGPLVGVGKPASPPRDAFWFRSLGYATRFRDANQSRFAGKTLVDHTPIASRTTSLVLGLVFLGAAAGCYYGYQAMTDDGYAIRPANLKGLILWLGFELIGIRWLTAGLVALGGGFLFSFLGSFRPARRPRRPAPT